MTRELVRNISWILWNDVTRLKLYLINKIPYSFFSVKKKCSKLLQLTALPINVRMRF